MDETFKAKWVAALRSGKYEQGYGGLKRGDEYCCLGVACDLYDSTRWRPAATLSPGLVPFASFDGEQGLLPSYVRESIGLHESTQETLADLNDTGGYSFTDIADWIEANL